MGARHLISIADLEDEDLMHIVHRGVEHGRGTESEHTLRGRVVGLYFRNTSTRTRTAFSSGALRLGAGIVTFGPNDLQDNTGETVEDTAEVLSRMLDGLVARTAESADAIRAFAGQARMPVINAMSADEHPTQALADLTAICRRFGRIEGIRVLYLGEGNNTAAALALALARVPHAEIHLRTPPGYGVDPRKLRLADQYRRGSGATVSQRHDLEDLPGSVDVVYTTRWQTTGTTKADPEWRSGFAPFRVDGSVMDRYEGAAFMHDLPAHRGEEVAPEVLDGPASIAFDQAATKLHSAMAVLEWALTRPPS